MFVQIQPNQNYPNDATIRDRIDFSETEPIHIHVLKGWHVLEPHQPRCYTYPRDTIWEIDGWSVRLTGAADIEGEGWATRELGEWPPPAHRRRRTQRGYGPPSGECIFLDPEAERVVLACDWAGDFVIAAFDARTGRMIRVRDLRGFLTEGATGRGTLDDLLDSRLQFERGAESQALDIAVWTLGLGLLLVRIDEGLEQPGKLSAWTFDGDLRFRGHAEKGIASSTVDHVGVVTGGLVFLCPEGQAHFVRIAPTI